MFKFALALFVLGTLPQPAEAHGGVFPPPPPPASGGSNPGPGDLVPGGSGGPGGSGPGAGGPSTPGPSGPAAPGRSGKGGPSTPAPRGPAAPAPSGPSSQGPASGALPTIGPDLSAWGWWWAYNQDPYLNLKQHILAGGVLTGSDDFFLGAGAQARTAGYLPEADLIQGRIGPALEQSVLEGGTGPRLEASLIALAKLARDYEPKSKPIVQLLSDHLDDPSQTVLESAVFALGLMNDASTAPLLLELASDGPRGRALVGRESVPDRTRALAVFALGNLAATTEHQEMRRFIVHGLVEIVDEGRKASPDLNAACVTAIGLAPLQQTGPGQLRKKPKRGQRDYSPAFSREGQLRFLGELLADPKGNEIVRAHIPKAIGLLARGADARHRELAIDALVTALETRRQSRLVRFGLIEGLGMVGDSDEDDIDKRARKALHAVIADGQQIERQLGLVALALVSSRAGSGEGDALASFSAERNFLMNRFIRGKSTERPWLALALGLQGFHGDANGQTLDKSPSAALAAMFVKTSSAEVYGSYAIALGLRRHIDAGPKLLERLKEGGDDVARGQTAIALGLLGERDAVATLEAVLEDSRYRPGLLRDCAIGLALLGEKDVVEELVAALAESESMAVKSAAVSALGFVGDVRAVEPLVAILEDPDQQELSRGFAAMALGVVCEEELMPWKAAFSNHLNYFATTPTLINGDGTGILNLR